jgi:hypothetical protein
VLSNPLLPLKPSQIPFVLVLWLQIVSIFPLYERLDLAHAIDCAELTVSFSVLFSLLFSPLHERDVHSSIFPVDHSLSPDQAPEQRFAALEALVTALGVRMEKLVLPKPSPDRVTNPTFAPPPLISDTISSHMITFRSPRFATVLSVESYRLRHRAHAFLLAQVSGLTTFANQIRPRLSDFGFTGESLLPVSPFLSQLARVADQSFLSEEILLRILEDFLRTPAKEAFRAQSLDSWPAAVHWLLSM